jgi:hypothetical protein
MFDLAVKLDDRRALLIVLGIPTYLTPDFNLAASNKVDLTTTPPSVTVEPFLVADVEPEHPKSHRLHGPLKSINQQNSTSHVLLRPSHPRRIGKFSRRISSACSRSCHLLASPPVHQGAT